MDLFETIVIAIVEGLTEFLPVSSTGHMIIAQSLLGVESTPFVKAFTVIIQFGAILSVICLYWKRFFYPNAGRKGKSYWRSMFDFYARLVVGVLPAVVLGLAFNDEIEANLGNVQLVAWMLIIGGIFMLFCDRIFNKGSEDTRLTYKRALMIGIVQCISMIPGVSRSMATIVGGMSQRTLIIGSVVAFIVAILAIKFFINYVTKYGFAAFGWYRIIVGLIIIICTLCGVEMKMTD